MEKELEKLEEGPKVKIHFDSFKQHSKSAKLENVRPLRQTWLLVLKIHFRPWQTGNRNEQMFTRNRNTRTEHQKIQKDPLKETPPTSTVL